MPKLASKKLVRLSGLRLAALAEESHINLSKISMFLNGYYRLRPEQVRVVEDIVRRELVRRHVEIGRVLEEIRT